MKLMRVDDALSEFRNLNQENRMLRANLEAFLTSDTDLKQEVASLKNFIAQT